MFSQTWKKYLPVIFILIKRAAQGEQTLKMNHTDFERAAGGRKIKFSFNNLEVKKGRVNSQVKHSPFARELSTLLQEDDLTKRFLADQHLEFSMTNDFQLTIRNHPLLVEVVADAETADSENNEVAHAE